MLQLTFFDIQRESWKQTLRARLEKENIVVNT